MTTKESFPFELDVCAHCEQVYRRPDPRQISSMAVRPVLKVRWESSLGARKTYGTRGSAYHRYAWMKMRVKYPCDGSCSLDDFNPPCSSGIHHPWRDDLGWRAARPERNTIQYLEQRFMRWLMWHDAKLRGGQRLTKPKRKTAKASDAALRKRALSLLGPNPTDHQVQLTEAMEVFHRAISPSRLVLRYEECGPLETLLIAVGGDGRPSSPRIAEALEEASKRLPITRTLRFVDRREGRIG